MKISPIKQDDDSACGPITIHMVLKYFGIRHSYKEIVTVSKYKAEEGLSNKDMVNALKKLNFNVQEKANTRWSDLVRYNTSDNAIIVSWMLEGYIGHFSIVEKVSKNFIELADPHSGKIIKIGKVMFMRLWLDYDDMWYPIKNTDIQLRWMCIVSKKRPRDTRAI